MTQNRTLLTVVAAVVVGLLALTAGVVMLQGGDPATVSLGDAVAAVGAKGSGNGSAVRAASEFAGTWSVVGDGASFVGYRVAEELAGFGATTAVGRTTAISGSLTFDGKQIAAVEVQADVSQLQSDQSRRDMALRQQALETALYPSASFALTSPIALDGTPGEGTAVSTTATGKLTVHGVERQVSIPLQGQFVDGRVIVVGSTELVFADFGIAQPRSMAVLSVADRATLELQLVFERRA